MYIRDALESLVSQSFANFELIISDNCSTDSTWSIVSEFALLDERINIYRQPHNIGVIGNYEYVLEKSKAKYFMWAPHDDIWDKNWLNVLIKNFHVDDIGIRGIVKLMQDDQIIGEKALPNIEKNAFFKCFMFNETDYRSHYVYSLFDRARLLTVTLPTAEVEYYPDAIFVYKLIRVGALRTIKDTYLINRVHEGRLGEAYSKKWRGLAKIIYRVHPLKYYIYYLKNSEGTLNTIFILLLIPVKHIYAQTSFWFRGARELITRKKYI
jgi:glycosyltransferase involved in cell wall biosynthesis